MIYVNIRGDRYLYFSPEAISRMSFLAFRIAKEKKEQNVLGWLDPIFHGAYSWYKKLIRKKKKSQPQSFSGYDEVNRPTNYFRSQVSPSMSSVPVDEIASIFRQKAKGSQSNKSVPLSMAGDPNHYDTLSKEALDGWPRDAVRRPDSLLNK